VSEPGGGVGSTVLEAEDKGGQGSIWAVAPLEREREREKSFIKILTLVKS